MIFQIGQSIKFADSEQEQIFLHVVWGDQGKPELWASSASSFMEAAAMVRLTNHIEVTVPLREILEALIRAEQEQVFSHTIDKPKRIM